MRSSMRYLRAGFDPRRVVDMPSDRPARRRGFVMCLLVILAAAATLLAACGSNSSSTSNSSAGSSNSSGSSGGGSSEVTAAQSKASAALKTPTTINQTVPLNAKPASGTKVIFLQCELAACADIASGVQAGAKAIGWSYSAINWKSTDPTTLITAMNQALNSHPYAVSFSGIPQAVWASEISKYQSAGVKLIPVVTGPLTSVTSTVPVEIGDFTESGQQLGNWFIADSGGKGHALLVDTPAFPILTETVKGASQAITSGCPACKTTTLNGTLAQVTAGSFGTAIVTAVRNDPSIKYIIDSDYTFISSLPSALKAAGLTDVKIAGGQPQPSDLAAIQSGGEAAAGLINNPLLGWMVIDSLARVSEKMSVPSGDGGSPAQLLTKANVTSTTLNSYAVPPNYQAQFMKLWKVG
jgi:ribose transport system substrate-binding protein